MTPDFETIFSQRFKIWIEIFTTRRIVNWKLYDASDFEKNMFLKNINLKKKVFLKSTILNKKVF